MRILALLLAVSVLTTAPMSARAETAPDAKTLCVAVLPFNGIGARPEDAFLSAGLAETLTAALARVHGVRVVERSYLKAVMDELKLQNSGLVDDATARKLGALVGASRLVIGSFQRAGARVRIICRLVDTQTGLVDSKHALTVTRQVDRDADLFGLQDDLVAAMLKSFGVTPSAQEQSLISQVTQATTSRSAYAFYVQGRECLQEATIPACRRAVRFFDQATQADIRFGLAWAGLSEALEWLSGTQRKGFGPPPNPAAAAVLIARARDAAQKALTLAPDLAESHCAAAACELAGPESDRGRLARAATELQKALSLNDRDADAHFLLWMAQGRPLGTRAGHLRTALEINPRHVRALTQWGVALMRAHRLPEAAGVLRRACEANPRSVGAVMPLADVLAAQGDRAGALAALRRCLDAIKGEPAYAQQERWVREKMGKLQQRPKRRR